MQRMKDTEITGQYSADGYVVFAGGEHVYSAGNSPHDSAAHVRAAEGVGLAALRRFCIQTCKDLAEERGELYGGVERV